MNGKMNLSGQLRLRFWLKTSTVFWLMAAPLACCFGFILFYVPYPEAVQMTIVQSCFLTLPIVVVLALIVSWNSFYKQWYQLSILWISLPLVPVVVSVVAWMSLSTMR